MSRDENHSNLSFASVQRENSLNIDNEDLIDSSSQLNANDVNDPNERNNKEEFDAGQRSVRNQIASADPSQAETNESNIPLLAPLILNRPPFDVGDFRRQMANIHGQGDEISVNRNMA